MKNEDVLMSEASNSLTPFPLSLKEEAFTSAIGFQSVSDRLHGKNS